MRKIRWGVLGAAGIARTRVIPAMKLAPSVEVTALASRRLETATEVCAEMDIAKPYGSYDELLADPEVDAVYLPLPNTLHCEWSVRAMEAGKHVLCEKPLVLSVDEIAVLRAARDRTGMHIEEAYVFRNHPQWARIDELLRTGEIGEPRGMQVTMALQFHDPNDIRNNPEMGGGALYDMGGYVLNACALVYRRTPLRVLAAIDRDPQMGIDRLSTALLDYGDAHATITVSLQAGPVGSGSHQLLSVLGSNGWFRMDYPLPHKQPTECHIFIGSESSFGGFETSTVTFPPLNQYTLQAERFSRYLLGDDVPSWPLETSLATLTIINALFRSEKSGQWETIAP